jgi:hypothetical protein
VSIFSIVEVKNNSLQSKVLGLRLFKNDGASGVAVGGVSSNRKSDYQERF